MRPAQNANLALIWNWRELPMMLVICPAVLLAVNFGAVLVPVFTNAVEVPGMPKFVRLKELNISARSCRILPSRLIGKFRLRLMSVVAVLGEVRMSGPTLPR